MAEQSELFEEPLPLTNANRVNRRGRGGRPINSNIYPGQMQPEIIVADENHMDNLELNEDH